MKTTLTTLLLLVLFFLGCTDTPTSPIEGDNHSYQLIKLPPKAGLSIETSFSKTKTIDGDIGGEIRIKEDYEAENGETIKIDVRLKVDMHAFEGIVEITLTVDDEFAAASFSPAMVFDIPVELDMKFEGLDLEELNLTNGDYDFVYIDEDGTIEYIEYDEIEIDVSKGRIEVDDAELTHFSRYGFVN